MLTIASGHSVAYLTDEVAAGRENYYTGAVAAGEPPGRWYGAGAEALGLSGLVDTQDMTALYEYFVDPRDEHFRTPSKWTEAATLGHGGRRYLSPEELYAKALDAEPNASPERRDELKTEANRKAKHNVAFHDATFSVQKSVTVLHAAFEAQQVRAQRAAAVAATEQARATAEREAAAWATHKKAVEDAIWAGNRAALDYLADKAGYSRIGHHGGAGGRWTDAHDWTVASFFQHDSREHDPQLHIHNAILNRVQGADGQWRTLDGQLLYAYRGAAAAVGERTMEAHLTRSLGVRFAMRPDGKAREILSIAPEVLNLFSARRRKITRKAEALVKAFEVKFDREPTALERDRLQRQATLATRRAKSHDGETVDQRLDRWAKQLHAELGTTLGRVAEGALAAADDSPQPQTWSPRAVIAAALDEVQQTKSAWTEPDLTRAISNNLPDTLGNLDGRQHAVLLDQLTERALTAAVRLDSALPGEDIATGRYRLANGRSSFERPGARLYATPDQVRTERSLVAAAAARGAPALDAPTVDGFVTDLAGQGIELGVDQAAAVRGVLTSGAKVESLVGPAGTGKSFVVGALAKAWQDPNLWDGQQRRVVGLAASQIATDVLAGEGVAARNITRWLATQQRLTDGGTGGDDQQWRLRRGDLVVIDESAMANTADLAAIHDHVHKAGGKLLLTGDHRQLAAIGAGGAMDMLAGAGVSYELAEARRFTQPWERDASLQLRAGDRSALDAYHKQGRLIDGGTREEAEASASRAWLADTLAGRHSLLIVDTNEQAAQLSASVRAELVRLGKVDDTGVPLGMQGTVAGRGDLVQARLNAWHLQGFEGNRRPPINREQYRVLDTRADGGLVVAPVLGRSAEGEQLGEQMVLPGEYVGEHMTLGYASTVHAAQGLTVDTSHLVATPSTGADALYVGMSRGRQANTAHVATTRAGEAVTVDRTGQVDVDDDHEPNSVHQEPKAILEEVLDTAAQSELSALETATSSEREVGSVRTPAEILAAAAEVATAERTSQLLDELVDTGQLTEEDRSRLAAEDGGLTLARLLRRAEIAGHDPRQVLTDAVTERPLDGARRVTNVIHERIRDSVDLEPQGASYAEWTPRVTDPAEQRFLDSLAAAADSRRKELGELVVAEQPQWAVEAFGPLPDEPDARAAWQERAATVAAHRELSEHTDPATALGPVPRPGQVEQYASWRAAWRDLGRPERADSDEAGMSDGQLWLRVRAGEREEAWGPRYVANELAGTRQAAEQHRRTATMRSAEAEATEDPAERGQLEQQAREADALAEVLDQRIAKLDEDDRIRDKWLVHTAETRAAKERAQAELNTRAVNEPPEREVTAQGWLDARAAEQAAEDPYREIHDETELADVAAQRDRDQTAVLDQSELDAVVETDVPDIREIAATEPTQAGEDQVRIAPEAQTDDSLAHARRTLMEIQAREAEEQRQAAEQAHAEDMARWHAEDLAAEQDASRVDVEREQVADYA